MKKKRIITLINYSSNGTFSTFILLVAFYFILSLDKISNPLNLRGEQTKISDSLLDNPLGFCGSKYRLPKMTTWKYEEEISTGFSNIECFMSHRDFLTNKIFSQPNNN
jgi:hypothetical protein